MLASRVTKQRRRHEEIDGNSLLFLLQIIAGRLTTRQQCCEYRAPYDNLMRLKLVLPERGMHFSFMVFRSSVFVFGWPWALFPHEQGRFLFHVQIFGPVHRDIMVAFIVPIDGDISLARHAFIPGCHNAYRLRTILSGARLRVEDIAGIAFGMLEFLLAQIIAQCCRYCCVSGVADTAVWPAKVPCRSKVSEIVRCDSR